MSLTDWVNWDKGLFDTFDKPKLNVSGPLLAPPLTKNYSGVGTAFDYATRLFAMQLNEKRWTRPADFAMVAYQSINNRKQRKLFMEDFEHQLSLVGTGKVSITDLLPSCLILAKLDSVFRSGQDFPDSELYDINPDDVQDLNNLYRLLNPTMFRAKTSLYLNPTFLDSSVDVGGADADIVIDDCLIDIKTVKNLEFTREHFRQLMGYYLLNLREEEKAIGTINYIGVYFSRYGLLFKFCPAALWPDLFVDIKGMDNTPLVTNAMAQRASFWANVEESLEDYRR